MGVIQTLGRTRPPRRTGAFTLLALATACAVLAQAACTVVPAAARITGSPPLLGRRELVTPVSGRVSVRDRGARHFRRITHTVSVPDGSEVETSAGRARITAAALLPGQTDSALAYGGRFAVHQESAAPALTRFTLSQPLEGCASHAASAAQAGEGASAATDAGAARKRHRARNRQLWVSESGGGWGTSGRYVSTSVEGTRWLTLDECSASRVRVAEGVVQVTDLVRHTTTTVSAGGSYTASQGSTPAQPFAPVYVDTLPRTGGEEVTPGLVSIGGHQYAHGIQMEVGLVIDREEAEYAIPAGAHTFSAIIGNDDNQPNPLWAEIPLLYEVFVDGRRVALARAQGSTSEPLPAASVAGGHTLKLVVINSGDAGGGTRADWAEPLFS